MSEPLSTERLAKIKERIEIASQEFYADKKSLIFEDLTIVVSELDRITRWRNIAEEQPEPGQPIVAYCSNKNLQVGKFQKPNKINFIGADDWGWTTEITHWLPIPPLPKENIQ